MDAKKKALIAGLIIVFFLLIGVFYLSYLGLSEDSGEAEQVIEEAEQYLSENFDQQTEVVDTLFDNTGVYEQFRYAAIVETEEHDHFRFLVYYHNQYDEYMDSYVAETWEYELEQFLTAELEERFGTDIIHDMWITYPKDVGHHLNIDRNNIPSLQGQSAKPIIRVTLDRGQESDDEDHMNEIISLMRSELDIPGGSFTLGFNDNALIFSDRNIREEF
ncbi:hypothetical protein [Alkalibacillus haloalkaliphilus]|uniref:hypothetical protein n=1 Tax=Alkalibacillus haloalkaliphilus TaxID=94136 RepID=UPI00031CD249|nr:hypothetical protein [Alkalibacillus haloalkaliphilus]